MGKYNILSDEEINSGDATDAYFQNTESAFDSVDKNPEVVAEMTESQMPDGTFRIFSGLSDIAELFKGVNVDVDAIPEGCAFDGGPVLKISGPYREFASLETSLLGFASQASAFATAATTVRYAAPEKTIMSFGARHLNPAITPVLERNALIAGLDGISHVAAGNHVGKEATGTMPHALIIPFGRGNQEEAWSAFNKGAPDDASRIALCDTFSDEVDEVRRAVTTLGEDLDGVRLDTTGSRRGDFPQIIEEVNWTLHKLGREDVDVIVSGGIGPKTILSLPDCVDGIGVGSYISNANPLEFGLDIVQVDGEDIAKRGKFSGVKEVTQTDNGNHRIIAESSTPDMWDSLYEPLIRDGDVVREITIEKSQNNLKESIDRVGANNIVPT